MTFIHKTFNHKKTFIPKTQSASLAVGLKVYDRQRHLYQAIPVTPYSKYPGKIKSDL